MPTYTYGGQALIEGVLMRGRDAIAVALRHPDGGIVFATERLDAGFHGTRWSKWPLIRGLVVLYETLVVGTRWLVRSANVQAEEEGVELGKGSIILMLGLRSRPAIGIFFLMPLFVERRPRPEHRERLRPAPGRGPHPGRDLPGLPGVDRRAPDIRRVFQYHGAEHMTIHALEAGDPLTVDAVRKYPTAHQRCGTEFLVVVIILSIIAFSLVGQQEPLVMIASRILLIPVIAAVGYEILRFGARHRRNPIIKVIMYPGILVQKITTKQPSDDMIEVAIVSMEEALWPTARRSRLARPSSSGSPMRLGPAPAGDEAPETDTPAPTAPPVQTAADRPATRAMSDLDAKLAEVARQYDEIQADLSLPETSTDPAAIRRLGQELSRLEPVVEAFRRLEATRAELAGARELRDASEADDEMRAMARDEIERLEADETRLLEELKVLLLPRDPNDDRDVIMEIRGGAGGDEAALFAAELYRMYVRYAERHRFTPEILSLNETGIGGIKEAIVQIHGDGAYSRLKFEGGVHRVQRIPATESSGRIHTSTVTVVVLPEVDEVEIEIDEVRDLRIDVKRSSGPGGQSVNTTDSAVRVTHLPTGLVVEIQDEKSQHKNKAKAIAVLRSRLYDLQQQKQRAADSAARRSMVGAGDRSDKIRTYNFPQDRVTDHRIGKTVHNLPSVMDGDLDDLIDALVMADQADRLGDVDGAA